MNRTDFMNQLESLLQNISPAEREEALQYYNEYFNDAGTENEQDVIEALGNPAKVAENIKRDLYGNGYGDTAYQRTTANDRAVIQYQQSSQTSNGTSVAVQEKKMSTWMIVLIVILCIFASPVILGLASGIFSAVVTLAAGWFSLILSAGIVAVVFILTMIILLIVGIMCMFSSVPVGIVLFGIGLLIGGIGLLFLMLTVAMAGIATPAIFRGCASLFRKITGKKTA